MTPEPWQKIRDILHSAMELRPSERAAYLDEYCAEDAVLRRRVDKLLSIEGAMDSGFLESPAAAQVAELAISSSSDGLLTTGSRLGPYEVQALLGVGGMGEVYRAMRADDEYRKLVAIKLVSGGQHSSLVINRFKNERQILANLNHPNIARLLDGGTSNDGQPYFVMELIEGLPIDGYCDTGKLPVTERLKLILKVCSAVQYAHQRLIIHRDIKPSNILVTGEGEPKLLDFGIAKILDEDTPSVPYEPTMTLFRVLTPGYASPEQVNGSQITTASDVYSLGVVLYELLAGRSPYRVPSRSPHELSRAVCEQEPEKPSSLVRRRASPDSGGRSNGDHSLANSRRISKQIEGDLDNIVLKALRKEPSRRYGSVEEFAGDIRRHFEHLPITARKGTAGYFAAKFVRRHTTGIVTTALVVVALIAALGVTLAEKGRADRRFNDVRALANSLLFEIHDSVRDLPGSTPARKLIVDRALRYLDSLSAERNYDRSLVQELAAAYERVGEVQGHYLQNSLGDTAGSLRSYQKALQLRLELSAKSSDWNDQLALAKCYRLVANQLWATGDSHDAIDNSTRALSVSEKLGKERPTDLNVLDELSRDYENAAQIREGISNATGSTDPAAVRDDYSKAAAVDAAMLKIDPDNEKTQRSYEISLTDLGIILKDQDRNFAGALDNFRKCLEIALALNRSTPTTQHKRDVAHAYYQIAQVYSDHLGDSRLALENYRKALEIYQQAITADPENAVVKQSLAIAYANVGWQEGVTGDKSGSMSALDRSLEIMKSLVAISPQNVQQQGTLAAMYMSRGENFLRWREAGKATQDYENACATYELLRPFNTGIDVDRDRANCRQKIGLAALQAGKTEVAAAAFHQSLDLLGPNMAVDKPDLEALYIAADSYSDLGDVEVLQAANRSLTTQSRKEHWKRARDWYLKSSQVWERIPPDRRERVGSPAAPTPKSVTNSLRRCETALASPQNVTRLR